ncbi:MAG: hypothetical protein K2K11_00525 [Bacteroidales bacterium]|nr:hypothetical protein [Bacteroidales bacterium]
MDNLKNLLVLPFNVTPNEDIAKDIVSNLMSNYVIQKGSDLYEIIEAEFYYYSHSHPDITVYERKMDGGRYFFHQSGVDITFKSHIEEINGKIDSQKSAFGGILIRSLKRISRNNVCEFILGPLNCVNHLWDNFNALEQPSVSEYPCLKFQTIEGALIEAEKRFYPVKEEQKEKKLNSLNSKFDEVVEKDLDCWLNRKYRFVRSNIKPDEKALKKYNNRNPSPCPETWIKPCLLQ